MERDERPPQRGRYHSYLLRLWREGENDEWYASIQDVTSGENRFFARMDLLVDFLYRETRPLSSADRERSPIDPDSD